MALVQSPSTPMPAPAINVPGLSCTGTKRGDSVNYECHTVPVACGTLSRYTFGHLLKSQFRVLAVVILVAIVAFTIAAITKFQLDTVKEMAFLVVGQKKWGSRVTGEYEAAGEGRDGEKKMDDTEAAKVYTP
ncbi:hypothetical protein F4860DRAFT_524987 [Xylaria cubensis]|nr:hypothetical protein F4860DRAFT_524987 [Xylaria cubensis]